jgi:hypothetical protein
MTDMTDILFPLSLQLAIDNKRCSDNRIHCQEEKTLLLSTYAEEMFA